MVHTESTGGAKEVGYRDRYRYDYRPYYRRYGDYRPRYRPYYGYPLDLETAHVVRLLSSHVSKPRSNQTPLAALAVDGCALSGTKKMVPAMTIN